MPPPLALPQRVIIATTAFRAFTAILIVVHGVFRIATGGVAPFGEFLASKHLPFGFAAAWVLSVLEVAGGLALAAGFFVVPLCAWFAVELTMGVILVHSTAGWFVVGGGRNGMEYSTLLIACLGVIAVLDPAVRSANHRTG